MATQKIPVVSGEDLVPFFFSKKKTTEEVKRRMFYRFSEINFFRKLLPEKVSCWLLLPLKKRCFLSPHSSESLFKIWTAISET